MKRFKAIGFLTILISLFLTVKVFSQIKEGETVMVGSSVSKEIFAQKNFIFS